VRFFVKNTPLSEVEAEAISTRLKPVSLKEDDYFLKAGMPVHKIGFLAGGILRRFTIDGKGNEIIQQFITEDHFFTDLDGYYEQKPSGAYIQAITPCQLMILSMGELETLKEEQPQLKLIIAQISEKNLLERIKMEDLLRTGTAVEKYKSLIIHSPYLAQKVSLKYIASYLGITQQSLSRIRRKKR